MLQQPHSHKKFIIPIAFLLIAVVALSGWGAFQSSNLKTAQNELVLTQNQLTVAQDDLFKTEISLTTAQLNLTQTQLDLTGTRNELSSTKTLLSRTQNDLTNAQAQITAVNAQISTLQIDYDTLKANYDNLTSSSSYLFADPTYAQMQGFLAGDTTDQKTYNTDTYNCQNFSADVIANAAKLKIRCAVVLIDERESGHAIIAFNTTDKGIIYIEPQSDSVVNLVIGKRYYQCVVPQPGYYYVPPSFDDTIVRFVVIW